MKVLLFVMLVCLSRSMAQTALSMQQLTNMLQQLQTNQLLLSASMPPGAKPAVAAPVLGAAATQLASVPGMFSAFPGIQSRLPAFNQMQPGLSRFPGMQSGLTAFHGMSGMQGMPAGPRIPPPESVTDILTKLENAGHGYPEMITSRLEQVILQEKRANEEFNRLESQGVSMGGTSGAMLIKRAETFKLLQIKLSKALEVLVEVQTDVGEFFNRVKNHRDQLVGLIPTSQPGYVI